MKRKSVLRALALLLCSGLLLACFAGCGKGEASGSEGTTEQMNAGSGKHELVRFEVEHAGEKVGSFTIELYPEHAPISCENFLKLVRSGFYEGKTFHRVVDGFMAQGGASENGQVETIKGEFSENGVNNELSHTRGVVSMARSNDPDSGSTQFFICYSDDYAGTLDGRYAAFGKVIEGMETIDKFTTFDRSYNGMGERATPVEDIVITSAAVVE